MMASGKDPKQVQDDVGMIGGRTGRAKKALRFGYDDGSQSNESRSGSSSEASDEDADELDSSAINKRSFSQILADVSTSRNPTLPTPTPHSKSEMHLWNTLSTRTEPRPSLNSAASQSPLVTMVGYEGTGLHHRQLTQSQEDERQLKQQKRKQSNRESARRSKLRKQMECEKLQTKVDSMNVENNVIKDEISRLAKELDVLKSENNNIMDELTQNYKYSSIPTLQINNFMPQSANHEDNSESSRTRDLFNCHGNFTP